MEALTWCLGGFPQKAKVEQCCTHFKFTDKQSIKICLECLEKLWNEAKKTGKQPQLVIGLRKNDDEVYMLTGTLTIEKQKKV
jgi:hypothetical protein